MRQGFKRRPLNGILDVQDESIEAAGGGGDGRGENREGGKFGV